MSDELDKTKGEYKKLRGIFGHPMFKAGFEIILRIMRQDAAGATSGDNAERGSAKAHSFFKLESIPEMLLEEKIDEMANMRETESSSEAISDFAKDK